MKTFRMNQRGKKEPALQRLRKAIQAEETASAKAPRQTEGPVVTGNRCASVVSHKVMFCVLYHNKNKTFLEQIFSCCSTQVKFHGSGS